MRVSTVKMTNPFSIALSPDASTVYTTENIGNRMHELDAASLTWLRTFCIGPACQQRVQIR